MRRFNRIKVPDPTSIINVTKPTTDPTIIGVVDIAGDREGGELFVLPRLMRATENRRTQ